MCLKKRGIKFKFFHKVTALHKSGTEISSIEMEVQAHPTKGEYEPLRKLYTSKYQDPFYVWGSAPDLSQLKEKDKVSSSCKWHFFLKKNHSFFVVERSEFGILLFQLDWKKNHSEEVR